MTTEYDYLIVGSGFGGSVSALRLVEKGYRVAMLEQGRELGPDDFPKSNWNIRRYLWAPVLGCRGLFRMSFFRHVTILTGVGVGGGSLVYACTHPEPNDAFFASDAWSRLADWKAELAPHYAEAKRMLGVTRTPMLTAVDEALRDTAVDRGRPEAFGHTDVAVWFGEAGRTVADPYFGGRGPERTGCTQCGGCMLGCRVGAKNSLDKNYLWLARRAGLELHADTRVTAVRSLPDGGYRIEARTRRGQREFTAARVIFAGGVLGTVELLLRMKQDPRGLPKLSDQVGRGVRTNSEAIVGVVSPRVDRDLSKGVAIGSIYQIDDRAHIEPVRYPAGSGLFRFFVAPHVAGSNVMARIGNLLGTVIRRPLAVLRAYFVRDFAKQSTMLLFMRTAEGSLRLVRSSLGGLRTRPDTGPLPTASIPEATELAHDVAKRLDGIPMSLLTETLLNIPTTAHVLGGCCMGESASDGVIDREHRIFGYDGLYVVDGSAVSANPGVNPSLTICALAERAMSRIVPSSQVAPSSRGSAATEGSRR